MFLAPSTNSTDDSNVRSTCKSETQDVVFQHGNAYISVCRQVWNQISTEIHML